MRRASARQHGASNAVGTAATLTAALVALLSLCAAPAPVCAALAGNVTVGVILNTGLLYSQYGRETRPIVEKFRSYVNSRARGIGSTGLGVDVVYAECADTMASASAAATTLVNAGVDVVLAPYSSDLSVAVALVTNPHHIVTFAPNAAAESVYICNDQLLAPCVEPFVRRFAYLLAVITPARFYFEPFVSLMKIQQAKSLALISENTTFGLALRAGTLNAATNNRLAIVSDLITPILTHSAATKPDDDALLLAALQATAAANPDAVVLETNTVETCYRAMELAYEHNLDFRAFAAGTCVGAAMSSRLGHKARYVYGPSQWDYRLTGNTYTETNYNLLHMFNADASLPGVASSAAQYEQFTLDTYGQSATYQGASVMAGLYQLYLAIALANSTAPDDIMRGASNTYESSFFGIISADRFGQNIQKPMVMLQFDGTADPGPTPFLVSPLVAAQLSPIYPMPKWSEREYRPQLYGTTAEKVVIALIALSCAVSAAFVAVLWRYRDTRLIKAISIEFCAGSIVGCMLVALSLLGFPVDATESTCMSQPWLLPLGLSLVLSPLAARQYRIDRIFNNRDLAATKNLTNTRLWLETCTTLLPQLVLSIVWSSAAAPGTRVVVMDVHRPALNLTECTYSDASAALAGVTFGLVCVQLVCVGVLAYRIRHVIDDFNESKTLAASAYVLVFCWAIIVALEMARVGNATARFWLRSILVLVSMLTFECVLFGPKLLAVVTGQGDKSYVGSGKQKGVGSGGTTQGGSRQNSHLGAPASAGVSAVGSASVAAAANSAGLRTRIHNTRDTLQGLLGGRTPDSEALYALLPAVTQAALSAQWTKLYTDVGTLLGMPAVASAPPGASVAVAATAPGVSLAPGSGPSGGVDKAGAATHSRGPRETTKYLQTVGTTPRQSSADDDGADTKAAGGGGRGSAGSAVELQVVTLTVPSPANGDADASANAATAPQRNGPGRQSTMLSSDVPMDLFDAAGANSGAVAPAAPSGRAAALSIAPPPPPPRD